MSFSIHLSAMKHPPFVDMVPIDMIPANYLSLVEDVISQKCFFCFHRYPQALTGQQLQIHDNVIESGSSGGIPSIAP